jgi:N-6 DNA Methylase
MAHRPSRIRQSRRAARLEFAGLEIVGALLTPDIVARVAAFDANDQSEESYEIPVGLKLRDEIARYYRIGEALWSRFEATRGQSAAASERFVLNLLRQCFGFGSIEPQGIMRLGEREFPVRHAALGGRVPIVIAPAPADGARRSGVDESLSQFGDTSRRRSATLLLQEYLNAQDGACWGLVSDGITLRILRDNISLTRPAWIEANLSKIFSEGLFPDFSALWLLIHQSRYGQAGAAASDCALERWRERGRTDGVAARDHLRLGVEAALLELGQGFIENPANNALRQALIDGTLSGQAYFEQLLRAIYRLIFLFAAEDRGLLHLPGASEQSRKVYSEGYSLARLRERSMRRTAWDRHGDSWEGLKASFHALMRGQEQLGLPALGGLFTHGIVPDLEDASIENRRLLAAVWRLAWLRPEGQPLTRVNWRDMETEELGSVYESLLELTPRASADARIFEFAEGAETKGNARKTSGSYYTPDALVKLLLDSTLEPVLDAAEARNPADPAAEILKLSIIDPACGSGHFLLGAARRAAGRISKLRSPGAPSQEEFQHALREVVSHCIYGVDRNPMAVELCKVALWIEALEPGKPLSFLDSHIRCGDSLVGVVDYEMLRKGVPDEAYKPLTGDDKETAKVYSKFNKQQREGKGATGFLPALKPPVDLIDAAHALVDMPEETLEQIASKRAAFERLHAGHDWLNLKIASDCYIAAFFIPKVGNAPGPAELVRPTTPLTDHVWAAAHGQEVYGPLANIADKIAKQVGAFHWPIEFPHIFARDGFDVVIGNPPWERIKLQEQEFFAARSPEIATAPNKAARERLIKALETADPNTTDGRLLIDFKFAKRAAEASSEFAHNSGRYPLTGTGDVNTYALFAEHFERLTNSQGRAGVMVPTGIATDSNTSIFFGSLIVQSRLTSLYSFYEIRAWFKGTDDRKSFCILGVGLTKGAAEFCFDIDKITDLENPERRFTLTAQQIERINPNTKTAPVFRSRADAELTAKLYGRAPVLVEEKSLDSGGDANPWGITFQRMFDMSNDSELFRDARQMEGEGWTRDGTNWVREVETCFERVVPLYESKMIHHFDHRWATYSGGTIDDEEGARDTTLAEKQSSAFEPAPRYWVPEREVKVRAARVPSSLKRAYRDGSSARCLKVLAEWLTGYFGSAERRGIRPNELTSILGANHNWRTVLGGSPERFLLDPKTLANGAEMQRETQLTTGDVTFLTDGSDDPRTLTTSLIERKLPRWLMGWRDISLRSVERTIIGAVIPTVGVGNNLPLWHLPFDLDARLAAAFVAHFSSLVIDFVGRHKIGGNHLNYFIAQQLPVLPPSSFSAADLSFITQRVLELSYTSYSMGHWAEDLGHTGAPFTWEEGRRNELRADLDAFFARKYGLTRDELRYVLDPADTKGADYPSETFRVLKAKEEARFGEYRTQRLVLEAWDRLAVTNIGNVPAQTVVLSTQRNGAWARPLPASPGDTGAMLAAILKTMSSPLPAREVRLATVLALEPRLLVPHLDSAQSTKWQRLVGSEAAPLTSNAISFAPRVDRTWGTAVISHRGSGRLVENLTSGTWAPGAGLDTIDTVGWPDGRAGMVMSVLTQISTDSVISAMPDEIRGWIDAAAA